MKILVLFTTSLFLVIHSAAQTKNTKLIEVKTTFFEISDTALLKVLESTLDTLPCIKEPDAPRFYIYFSQTWAPLDNYGSSIPPESYWLRISSGQIAAPAFDSALFIGATLIGRDTILIGEFFKDKNVLRPLREGVINVAEDYSSFQNDSLLSRYESVNNFVDFLFKNDTFEFAALLCR